ncbi:MAG: diguanylate cyclase [Solidesulfovibrio sp. DCME]|uniref:diguanylate cyclase n=1 Tax=Solidesulfovibrio sp. DCME TaxID=3447380 RepID=UPI003D0CB8F4
MRWKRFLGLETLRGTLRFYSLLLVASPVVLGIFFFLLFEREQVLGVALNHLTATLQAERKAASAWMESRLGDVVFLASLDAARDGDLAALTRIFESYRRTHQFVTTVVYATAEGYTAADPLRGGGIYVGDRDYFSKAREGLTDITAVEASRGSGGPICIVSAPVADRQGRFVGVIFMPVEMDSLSQLLGMSDDLEAGGRVFLATAEGRVLSGAGPEAGQGAARISPDVLRENGEGSVYAGPRGQEMIGATVPLGVRDWMLVRQAPTAEVLAGYRRQMVWVGAGALATILVLTPFLLRFLRRVERPLLFLARYARQLRATDYKMDCPPPVQGTMPRELAELSEAFCTMADEVRSHVAEAQRQSVEDALTGLFNRRFLFSGGAKLLDAAARAGRPCACLMLDLDYFKNINDTHGHRAGDRVLAHLGRVLSASVRKSDLVARYGGEEFAVLLTGADAAQGAELAERIRVALVREPCRVDDVFLPVTASFGVAEVRQLVEFGENPLEDLLARADKALYAAKAAGRDRVVVDKEPGSRATRPDGG